MTADRIQQLTDPDALYSEGMAFYRRRRWHDAKDCFEQVRALQPNRRGIEALLRELDIFLQLESVEDTVATEILPDPFPEEAPVEPDEIEASRRGRGWITFGIMVLTVVVVVGVVLWFRLNPSNPSDDSLRNLGQAYLIAQQCDKALNVYARLVNMIPDDPEALNGLRNSKSCLYEQCLEYEAAGNVLDALECYGAVATVDPEFEDLPSRMPTLELEQELDVLYQDATKYLDARAWSKAIAVLLNIRNLGASYRPGMISDDLYTAYMARGQSVLDRVADDLVRVSNPKAAEPGWAVTEAILANVREAEGDFGNALQERLSSKDAKVAEFLAANLRSGLEFYNDWAWGESIDALIQVYDVEPDHLRGKVALVLCDAYLHLGNFYLAREEYAVALAQYQAMRELRACDSDLAAALASEAGLPLTPTATPTFTPEPTATPTPTNTLRPTATLTRTPIPPTATPVPTLAPTQVPTTASNGGSNGGDSKPKPPKIPTPKPRN